MAALRQTSGRRAVVTPGDIGSKARRPPSQMNGARTTSRIETSGPVSRANAPKTVTSNEQNTIR